MIVWGIVYHAVVVFLMLQISPGLVVAGTVGGAIVGLG